MKTGLFILPFLSIFFAAFFATLSSSFSAQAVIFKSIGWGFALGLLGLWGWLDRNGFKKVFARKGAKYGASSGIVLILAIGIFIGISVITSKPRFDKTYDLSRDKTNTLSDQSTKAIETLTKKNAEMKVTAYFIDQQQEQSFRDLIGLYLNAGAKMSIEYINPQKDPTRAISEKLTSGNTVIFKLGTQENRVTTFTEEKITNALVAVLKEGSKKIYFTKGHGEGQLSGQEPTGFELIHQELKNNRYEVADVNLIDAGKVPDDAAVLVIAGPKYDFKEGESQFIGDFIGKGGSVLALVDALAPVSNINKALSKYGISFNNDFMILRPDDPRAQLLGQNNAIIGDFDEFSPVTKDFARKSNVAILFQNTRTVSELTDNSAKFKVSLIGKTAGETTVKVKNVNSANDLKGITSERIEQGSFAVMATATGKIGSKDVRVAAYGSSQFATNQGAQTAEHRDLLVNTLSWLTQDDDFIAIRPKDTTKSTLSLATGGATLNLLFISYIYPFLFLGFGAVYWMRRRQA
jgi:ABC-2 type transport system permease protein